MNKEEKAKEYAQRVWGGSEENKMPRAYSISDFKAGFEAGKQENPCQECKAELKHLEYECNKAREAGKQEKEREIINKLKEITHEKSSMVDIYSDLVDLISDLENLSK